MRNYSTFTMFTRCLIAAGLAAGLAWCREAQAATYVVNPHHAASSDEGPGSQAKPFRTLKHAVQAARAGDTVLVMPGSYGRITVATRGAKDSPVVIRAAAAPSQAHVDKAKLLDPKKPVAFGGDPAVNAVTKGFVLKGARYVRVQGFEITAVGQGVGGIFLKDTDGVEIVGNFLHDLNPRKGGHGGIRADTHDNRNVLIRGNTLFRCAGTSICMMGENWKVEGNDISRGTNLNTATGEKVGGEDAIRVFGRRHIIRRNYVYDFLDAEQFPKSAPHLDAFQTFSVHPESQYASDVLIEENYCANIGQMFMGSDTGAKEGTNPIHDFTLRGNVFRGAHAYALIIGRGCDRFTVVNNVVTESYYGAVIVSGRSHHATVVNNIFYNNSRSSSGRPNGASFIDESSREGSMMDYNLCNYTYTYPPRVPGYDDHSKIGVDPGFVDAGAGDYRLRPGSPAIGAGDPAIKSPDGKPLDMGAFQFGRPESDWFLEFIKNRPSRAKARKPQASGDRP